MSKGMAVVAAVVAVLGLIVSGAHADGAADAASPKPVQRCEIEGWNGPCKVNPQLVLARLAASDYLRSKYLARTQAFAVICTASTEEECAAWGSDNCSWMDYGDGYPGSCTPADNLAGVMIKVLLATLYCPGTRPYNLMRCSMQAELADGNTTAIKKAACEDPEDNGCVWVKNAANSGESACLNQYSAKMKTMDLVHYMDKLSNEQEKPVYNPAKYGCCATWLSTAMNQWCMNMEKKDACATRPYCRWSGEDNDGVCVSDDMMTLKMLLPKDEWDLLEEDIAACSAVPLKQDKTYGFTDEAVSSSSSEGEDSKSESASEGPSDEELCAAVRVSGVELLTPEQVLAIINEEPPIVDIKTCPAKFTF